MDTKINKPFFSVIIPTLNEESYLPTLLDNLVKQNFRNFEVIIVDGGSTDATVKTAVIYGKQIQITVIKVAPPNVCTQRNKGAIAAKGKYLVFFDADVQIKPKYLEFIYKFLLKKESDFLTTYILADNNSVYDRTIARMTNIACEIAFMIDRPFIIGCNFLVKKEVFAASGGFNPKIKFAEDYELAERLYKAGYILHILKYPKLTFSLRRFRYEGRLQSLRKTAKAGLHILTKGHITKELFVYPMGGGWYKFKQKAQIKPQVLARAESYIRKFVKLVTE